MEAWPDTHSPMANPAEETGPHTPEIQRRLHIQIRIQTQIRIQVWIQFWIWTPLNRQVWRLNLLIKVAGWSRVEVEVEAGVGRW